MNILILTYGTRGDVQPFIAFGRGLVAKGHDVWLATSTRFEGFVRENGLKFFGISDELLAILDTPEGKEMMESTRNIFDMVRHNITLAKRMPAMLRKQLDDSWFAAKIAKPDFVVYHPKGIAGPVIAEAYDCPAILALPFPMLVATEDRPQIGFPALPFGKGYNQLTYSIVNTLTSSSLSGPMKAFRKDHDLPEAKTYKSTSYPDGQRMPSMTCVSPSVVPEPEDWDDMDRMVGYWFMKNTSDYRAPAKLAYFLANGAPPIYIGFGSISGKEPEKLANIAIEALKATGQRGILATGWGGLKPGDLPDSILEIESAPHDWLFPKCAAVVHHGGAGTTAAGLRAGIPSIITPFLGDQPFWGKQIESLGVGPAPIDHKALTADNLAEAIRTAITDPVMRRKADALGARLRNEHGVKNAIRFIEEIAAQHAS
ncbi:glycosyltransferase [Ponticaulis sp.]|uniref:glycosyltransferase n=1 Tax=Ponticaulis sp. TaxID=2020902 RepID=UPI000B652076|nr:glycosyltransferase [Ponticaulis sp.]MAI90396.1 UDP-glucose--sterol glucosyltransferase [Ponticaulis sp.]OUY00098.1 MAG: hypothetical protein CBB65_08150 [Hyphomonadaceae bacterium TMED5]|tara:strand:- start:11923 stop:13206 length:1284 start_codon:yes stop_codon:yes gene_type:complete